MKLIALFFNICILKRGPQDTPYSYRLFGAIVMLYWLTGVFIWVWKDGLLRAGMQAVVEMGLFLVFIAAALWFVNKTERFVQTATAALACDAIISLIAFPTLISNPTPDRLQMTAMIILLCKLWYVTVLAHIFRSAMSKPWVIGLLASVLYICVVYTVMPFIFPPIE